MPRGVPNMISVPSGDQSGKRWGRSLWAATASAAPPTRWRTRISKAFIVPAE
jgi:hypothetical protein